MTDGLCTVTGSPPCGGHGFCISDLNSVRCDCHPGYHGDNCETVLQEWNFEKKSWIHYQFHVLLSLHCLSVQLMVRTRMASCTILSLVSSNKSAFLRLEVVEGHFAVRLNFGEREHLIRLPSLRIDHGRWILLSFERYDNSFTLMINKGGGDHEVTSVMGTSRLFDVDSSSILLGSSSLEEGRNDFQGCLRDIRLNGHHLPMDGLENGYSSTVSVQGVSHGCLSDACRSQPCQSPLNCIDLWRKYECRCPAGEVEVINNMTGQKQCYPSPCMRWSCRNGGTCVAQSHQKYVCQCRDGYKGRICESIQINTARMIGLSSGSILAISMCLLIFIALLVSYTVWSQWGSSKFRKGGVYHIPPERESWEDIRESVITFSEESGVEHNQCWKKASKASGEAVHKNTKTINGYNKHKPKRSLRENAQQLCSSANDFALTRSHQRSEESPLRNAIFHKLETSTETRAPSFQVYAPQMIWAADNDMKSHPLDLLHNYSTEGQGSPTGSLSSLDTSSVDEDLNYDYLQEWGCKFDRLKELYYSPSDKDT